MNQLSERIEELKPKYVELLRRRREAEQSLTDYKLREAMTEIHKDMMREAFLVNSLTTEEDFERLWPRILDDYFCETAGTNYKIILEALHLEIKKSS